MSIKINVGKYLQAKKRLEELLQFVQENVDSINNSLTKYRFDEQREKFNKGLLVLKTAPIDELHKGYNNLGCLAEGFKTNLTPLELLMFNIEEDSDEFLSLQLGIEEYEQTVNLYNQTKDNLQKSIIDCRVIINQITGFQEIISAIISNRE